MSLFPEKFDDWMLDKNFYDLKKGQHIMTIPKTGYYKARISELEKFAILTRNELKMEVNKRLFGTWLIKMIFKSEKVILSAYGEGQSFGCKITQIDFLEKNEKIMFFIKEGVFLYEYHHSGNRSYFYLTKFLSRLTLVIYVCNF